jgi:hypothetical protein
MPSSLKQHIRISQLLLGYVHPQLHKLIDSAVKLLGPGHRLLHHNLKFLEWLEWETKNKELLKEALLHLLTDANIIKLPDFKTKGDTNAMQGT